MKKLLSFILSSGFFFAALSATAQDSSRLTKEKARDTVKQGNVKGEKLSGTGKADFSKRKPLINSIASKDNKQKKVIERGRWKNIIN